MLSSLVDGYGSSDESDGDNDATAPLVAESAKPAPAADQFKDAEGAEESAKRGRSSSSLPASVRTVPGSLPPARELSADCAHCAFAARQCVCVAARLGGEELQVYCRVGDI
jgi:hypothetical protein